MLKEDKDPKENKNDVTRVRDFWVSGLSDSWSNM